MPLVRILIGAALVAATLAAVAADATPLPAREALELAKLQAEIAKLRAETAAVAPWYAAPLAAGGTVLAGFLGVIVTGWFGWRQAVGQRVTSFDLRLFEKRLDAYPALLKATALFALHAHESVVDPRACERAGHALREQYFTLAGALMTAPAQRRYMTLQSLLTRAARVPALRVPRSAEDYAAWIDQQKIDRYRELLGLTRADADAEAEMAACRRHVFLETPPGEAAAAPASEPEAARRFQDFVVLQFAASRLRTELGRDVNARAPILA